MMLDVVPRAGEITEIVGRLSSGRTSLLMAMLRRATRAGAATALVDVDDVFDAFSATRAGVGLDRLLWVRCGRRRDVALCAADLLVRCPGFAVVGLDLGELAPRLSLAAAFRLRLAAVSGTAPATGIVEANTVARALGVHPAMTETEARARCPELTSRPLADEVQATACYALLDAALVVSPRVEDAGIGVVHVDTTGLERLIGDASAVGRRLLREARAVGFTASVGLAESRATAGIVARLGRSLTVVAPGRERQTLAAAPLAVVEPDAATALTLARWGIQTLGELAALPRDDLAARLGAAGLRLHDLACGLDRDPFRIYTPPPFYQEAQGVDWEIDRLDALAAALTPVLERLCARLTASHLAADVLDIDLRLASGEHHQRRVPLAHPLVDPTP